MKDKTLKIVTEIKEPSNSSFVDLYIIDENGKEKYWGSVTKQVYKMLDKYFYKKYTPNFDNIYSTLDESIQ